MTKFLFLSGIIVCFGALSCSEESKGSPQYDTEVVETSDSLSISNPDTVHIDSGQIDTVLAEEQQDYTGPFPRHLELDIYPFSYAEFADGTPLGLIPLTDMYDYSQHPDSIVIEETYLGEKARVNEKDNYHVLDLKYRKRFLNRLGIEPKHNVYIYNVAKDSLEVHQVADLELVAHVTPYGVQGRALAQEDYIVGFTMKKIPKGAHYLNHLVYIGEYNPFNLHALKPVKWEPLDSDLFPEFTLDSSMEKRLSTYEPLASYQFQKGDMTYHLMNLGKHDEVIARHMVVTSGKEGKVIYQDVFIDSEGTYLQPLNAVENSHYNHPLQYTGQLFKNRPPVIFSFLGVSFGCPKISFISKELDPLFLRCDNRH